MHTHIYIYIHMYAFVCMLACVRVSCVCACMFVDTGIRTNKHRRTHKYTLVFVYVNENVGG